MSVPAATNVTMSNNTKPTNSSQCNGQTPIKNTMTIIITTTEDELSTRAPRIFPTWIANGLAGASINSLIVPFSYSLAAFDPALFPCIYIRFWNFFEKSYPVLNSHHIF
jgi:hypothetical protein